MKKEKISIFLFTLLTCFSLSLLDIIPSYSFISLVLFVVLFGFYEKELNKFKKRKALFIISIFFSMIFPIGKILYDNYNDNLFLLFSLKNIFKIILCIIGLTPLFNCTFNYLLTLLCKVNIKKSNKINLKYWFIFSLIIFLGWIPYFLINYPGIVPSDVIDQLNQFLGFRMLNDHHPVFHTMYVGTLYKIFSFGGSNFAIACSVVVQMLILSLIFGYSIYYLNNRGLNKFWTIIILIFYITPIFGMNSVNLWKDSIFSGLVVLLIISIVKICDSDNKSSILLFIISSALCLMFRNNAIYMYMMLIIFSFIILRKKLKKIIICFGVVLLLYFTIKGPIYKNYNISKGSSAEYLAIPIQQISRMITKDIKLNKADKKLINDIIDINVIKDVYNPYTSDNIKFNNNFNIIAYDNNKVEYLKLWLRLIIKHPFIATESYLLSTLSYWNTDVYNCMYYSTVEKNNLKIYSSPKVPHSVIKILNLLNNKNIPILSLEYSCSFAIYLILFSLMLCYFKKNKKYLLCYIPIFGLWLSIMIATPVASEFRYIFWSYTCLPLLLFIPFSEVKENE